MGKKEESPQLEKKGAVDAGKYDVDEHVLSVEEVAKRYATRVDVVNVAKSQGLSKAEAEERLSKNGPNALTPPKTLPEWLKYLKQYTNPLLMLLIVACILSFVAYAIQTEKDLANIYIGSTLFVVVFVLATEAYRNERAATKAANALRSLLPSVTNVIRDGQESQEHAANLVVGDVVHLLIGTRVPADIKIIEAKDLKLDFSSLTGEADPIPMSAVAKHDAPHESHNIAFMSSQVLNGEGRGIVIRCGDATFIGNINTLTAGTATQETTLVKDIRIFVTFIAVVALTMAIILFGVGLGRGFKFADAFVNGLVVVLVANIPQGLPATVTAMLSSCAMKMKEKRVVAKRSDIVEALGAASRIASDKTGTLTQNKMTVMNCWVNRQFRSATEIVATAPRRNLANLSRASGGAGGMLARVSAGLRRISAGIGRVSARKNDSGSQFSHTTGGVDDSDSQLPPSMHSGHGLAKTSSIGNRFGTDILSRMSIGGGGIGRQSSAVRQLAQLSRTSTFTFALNASPAPHPGTDANSNTFQLFSPLSQLLTIACCNNKAQFAAADPSADTHAMAERKVLGDATDSGLLRFCDKLVDVDGMRTAFKQVYAIPFNSKNKWALTMVEVPGDDSCYLVMIKGAPEYVMQRCTKFQHRGKEHEMNDDFKEDMNEAYQSFGMMAERVIGHAFKLVPRSSISKIPDSQEEAVAAGLVDNFTFCGLLSLIDPPRDAVPPAVETVRRAGVGVTMVTGDHPLTAEAIARKCHIITTPTRREVAAEYGVEEEQVAIDDPNVQALVVTGTMIDQLVTDDDWDKVMDKEEIVFARTTPQQKLLIVSHFQRRGEVVAVTGDGVNDSPALRRADIGVAMGNPDSSEVAREAADVVLLDDDFAALVMAIEEGRCLYDNLKKTIAYTLCHIPPETSAVIMNLLLGMPLGLGAMLVLTIDLFTEQGPASSLAFEPAEANLMDRPPRNIATERLVSFPLLTYSYFWAGIAQALCCIGAYLWTFKLNDVPASEIFWLNPKDGTWLVLPDNIERSVFIDGKEFTAEMQADIVRQANSSWYITLIVSQAWHIWVCKTRRVSIFKHPGIYTNRNTIVGVIIAITIMLLCVYIPALQEHVFYDANPPALAAWIPHFFFGAYILIFTETLKKHAREHPNDKVTKLMAW